MAKLLGLTDEPRPSRAADAVVPEYRAITQGGERDEWAVVDDQGAVVYQGDARVAAMIASRLTRPER